MNKINETSPGIIWVASYPKSGNTWVRFILAALLGYDATDSSVIEEVIPDIHKRQGLAIKPGTRNFAKTHYAYDTSPQIAQVTKGFIYVLRNPLDVLASNFSYLGIDAESDSVKQGFVEEFVSTGGLDRWRQAGMGSWEHNLESWAHAGTSVPYVFLRYEDMLMDPASAVRQIAEFIALEPTPSDIDSIVAQTSFEALSTLENQEKSGGRRGFFTCEARAKKKKDFRFMNQGRSGTYADVLTDTQIARVLDRFQDTMRAAAYDLDDFSPPSHESPSVNYAPRPATTAGPETPPDGCRSYVYIATGERYLNEAAQSVASLRRHDCYAHCILYTDAQQDVAGFDDVRVVPPLDYPFLYKAHCLSLVPEERFVFLDTDTHIADDISDIFALLDKFDLAASHAPVRVSQHVRADQKRFCEPAPLSFPEFNTGVLGVKQTIEMERVLSAWPILLERQMQNDVKPMTHDQLSFRQLVYESHLRLATLPPEYNCRLPYPVSLCGPVKILHGRHKAIDGLAGQINRTLGFRAICSNQFRNTVQLYQA